MNCVHCINKAVKLIYYTPLCAYHAEELKRREEAQQDQKFSAEHTAQREN